MNYTNVRTFLGSLLIYFGFFLMCPLIVSLLMGDGAAGAFGVTLAVTFLTGFALQGRGRVGDLSIQDAFAIVTIGWLAVSLLGAFPFVITGSVASYTDAFFEAVSGVTTTGATVIPVPEEVPESVLLWRSLLQWLGGMGFIVLSIAVLPKLAVGGMELFKAEVPTPLPERLKPKLRETALILWRLYLGLTIVLFFLLLWAGMNTFDAALHALTTLPSGGFSTRSAGVIAFNNPVIELILFVFMLLAGANFTLYYRALAYRSFREITGDTEFQVYLGIILCATAAIAAGLVTHGESLWQAVRHASFQAVSIITTTGFASADYNAWPVFPASVLILLMFAGGSSGSTAGGIKILRHIVAAKHIHRELFRLIHPRVIRPVRVHGQALSEPVITSVFTFLLLYMGLVAAGTVLIAAHGIDLITAATAAAAAIGNVGPGLGKVGPLDTYAFFPPTLKLVLSLLMLIGRLEIYTVLVLFLPGAWSRKKRGNRLT